MAQRLAVTRVQDMRSENGYELPPWVSEILHPDHKIKATEIFCRLVHVCMVEAGFIPVTNDENDLTEEKALRMTLKQCQQRFGKSLGSILDKTGSLHNVTYKAVVTCQVTSRKIETTVLEAGKTGIHLEAEKPPGGAHNHPVTAKESGDGSFVVSESNGPDDSSVPQRTNPRDDEVLERRQVYSEPIFVSIIHDGFDLILVGNCKNCHKNMHLSLPSYIHPTSALPETATVRNYLTLLNFSGVQFATDVKRKFIYEIMDEIEALSFDVRSLAWLPPEIIVEIAKWCSSLGILRLRCTCREIRDALDPDNVQFWKYMLKKDFPNCDLAILQADPDVGKYYKKYSEMFRVTFRPIRRPFRPLPFYFLNNAYF